MKNKFFQSRDLCLRALDTNSVCAKSVRRNERRMKEFEINNENDYLPLRDVVFNTLRTSILTGELKPGERLMEIHLADKLGVSRTPIREAIRKLELEGLVTMIPRRGAEVAQITEKNLRDVLEVRRALDALAVELACERITEDELAELKKACENFELETKRGNANQVAQADVELHDIILKASGNERLMQMISKLSQQMYRYRLEYVKDEANYKRRAPRDLRGDPRPRQTDWSRGD